MRFSWNGDIAAWRTVTTESDADSGPPGPAGVSVLRAGDTAISLCTMTGRVTSARVSPNPDEQEQALLGLVFAPDAVGRWSPRDRDIELATLPAAERETVAALAHLRDAVAHVDFGPNIWASYLAHLELVGSLLATREQHPTGRTLVPASEVSTALAAATIAADRLLTGPAATTVARRLGGQGLAAAVRVRLDATVASLRGRDAELTGPAELLRGQLAEVADTVDAVPPSVPHTSARRAHHAAADAASRAGWAALQQARARGDRSCPTAELIFAELTAAWWRLGARHRSCWAWHLADRDAARRALTAAGLSPAEVEAHALGTVVPDATQYLSPALWTLATPAAHLLPAPVRLVAS